MFLQLRHEWAGLSSSRASLQGAPPTHTTSSSRRLGRRGERAWGPSRAWAAAGGSVVMPMLHGQTGLAGGVPGESGAPVSVGKQKVKRVSSKAGRGSTRETAVPACEWPRSRATALCQGILPDSPAGACSATCPDFATRTQLSPQLHRWPGLPPPDPEPSRGAQRGSHLASEPQFPHLHQRQHLAQGVVGVRPMTTAHTCPRERTAGPA